MTIYAHPEARDRLVAGAQRFRDLLRSPTESMNVETKFGRTHLLVGGPPDAPPLLVFHGAMASSAHVLSEMQPMLENFRVYAADIPGHSPLSADTRLQMNAYGDWALDVLDALGLARVNVLGVSWGGFVAAQFAETAPDRIERLSLVVPAGIVSGKLWEGITKLAIPMAIYRAFPSPSRLRKFASAMFTTVDDLWVPWLGEAMQGLKMDFRAPPLARSGAFERLGAPVQVIAASDDVHFPGPALLRRAAELFPTLRDTWLIADCKHSPPFDDGFRAELSDRLTRFFRAE